MFRSAYPRNKLVTIADQKPVEPWLESLAVAETGILYYNETLYFLNATTNSSTIALRNTDPKWYLKSHSLPDIAERIEEVLEDHCENCLPRKLESIGYGELECNYLLVGYEGDRPKDTDILLAELLSEHLPVKLCGMDRWLSFGLHLLESREVFSFPHRTESLTRSRSINVHIEKSLERIPVTKLWLFAALLLILGIAIMSLSVVQNHSGQDVSEDSEVAQANMNTIPITPLMPAVGPVISHAHYPIVFEDDRWELHDSTSEWEEFQDRDSELSIYVTQQPTPVSSQDELDTLVKEGLDDSSMLYVRGSAPVIYEEYSDDMVTRWYVRLVNHFQISLGCQAQEFTEELSLACTSAVFGIREPIPDN